MAKIYLNGVAYLGGGASDADSVKIVSWDSIPTPDQTDVIGRAVFNSTDNHFYSITENPSHNKIWSQITMPSDVSVTQDHSTPPTGVDQLIYDANSGAFYVSKIPAGETEPEWEEVSLGGGTITIAPGQNVTDALQPAITHSSAHYYTIVTQAQMNTITMAGLNTLPNVTYYIVEA